MQQLFRTQIKRSLTNILPSIYTLLRTDPRTAATRPQYRKSCWRTASRSYFQSKFWQPNPFQEPYPLLRPPPRLVHSVSSEANCEVAGVGTPGVYYWIHSIFVVDFLSGEYKTIELFFRRFPTSKFHSLSAFCS
jgi:hypothetical protein